MISIVYGAGQLGGLLLHETFCVHSITQATVAQRPSPYVFVEMASLRTLSEAMLTRVDFLVRFGAAGRGEWALAGSRGEGVESPRWIFLFLCEHNTIKRKALLSTYKK
jgi:hypothetical protein